MKILTGRYVFIYQYIGKRRKGVRNSTVSQGVYDVKGDPLRCKRKPITTKRQIDKDRKTKRTY